MKTKTWIGATLLIALVTLTLAALVSCQNGSGAGNRSKDMTPTQESSPADHSGIGEEKVQFSSPCMDIVDQWTAMPHDERIVACQEILGKKAEELAKMGFEPQACQVREAEVQDCGIGTELACTYTCGEAAE